LCSGTKARSAALDICIAIMPDVARTASVEPDRGVL
jgi:hypothetical protein